MIDADQWLKIIQIMLGKKTDLFSDLISDSSTKAEGGAWLVPPKENIQGLKPGM